jgi:glycerol uptake facilitator protein
VSIALATWGRFTWGRVVPYIAAQLVGAFLAAAVLYGLYHQYFILVEGSSVLSPATAKCYGEYYGLDGRVNWAQAFGAEVFGTALLAFVVFATTDESNRGRPADRFAPVFVGLTVTALICVLAPLTQACFNPARDFGPRLFAYLAGWGAVAIPGPNGHGFFTVYIGAPIVGAVVGSGVYQFLFREAVHATSFEKGS